MTDIEQKALALVNEVLGEWGKDVRYSSLGRLGNSTSEALFRAIEAHEAFKQEVSDALHVWYDGTYPPVLDRFIIPKPNPDPLVRVINEVIYAQPHGDIDEVRMADDFRAALEARGLEIREKNDDQ